jgi:hypothetical protein
MSIWDATKTLASEWYRGTKRTLAAKGRPQTKIDSGGSLQDHTFQGQDIDRDELRDVRDMRESGGTISELVHRKAIMQFGPGAEFQAENDAAAQWLHEQFNDLDNLLIDLGEDATWYPYSAAEIVETQGGDFSHIEPIQPWTILPRENEVGEIVVWEQSIQADRGQHTEVFNPEDIAWFVLNKSSARDKTGVSEVLRAEEEITNYKENQQVMNDALQYLVPHHHWIVGGDNQSIIDDNELRRFRNRIDNLQGDTQIISGNDVKHEQIDLPSFDVQTITQNDIRQVCVALGVPIELASVVSEGLGSGEQSSVRETFFELEKDAKQRSLAGQFVQYIARPLLRDYSPFNHEQDLELVFRNVRTPGEKKTTVDAIGDDLTVNERRELFEYAELDDEEKGEGFDSPGEEGAAEDGPLPFLSSRKMQTVPDDAVSIDDPSDAPEDAEVITGPRGGTYAVPSGSGGGTGGEDGGDKIPDDVNVQDEEALREVYENADTDVPLADVAQEADKLESTFSNMLDSEAAAMMAINNLVADDDTDPSESENDDEGEYTPPENPEIEDELTKYSDGDEITVDTEKVGEVSGDIVDTEFIEYGDVIIKDVDGNEHVIPVDEINSVESGITASAPFQLAYTGGSGNAKLAGEHTADWERHYLDLLENVAWADDTSRNLVQFNESEVPEMVKQRLRNVILGDAVFDGIDAVGNDVVDFKQELADSLTDDGWSLDDLAGELSERFGMSKDRAELVARTETASAVNTAREEAYEERGLEDAKFRWVSTNDDRRTDACEWLTEKTKDGVSMERLKELIDEAPTHDPDMQNDLARPDNYVVHPNERSTWVRVVE